MNETACKGVDRIHTAEDRLQWWIFVNTVSNLGVSDKAGNFSTS